MEEIRNKVAESGILTIDLVDYKPDSDIEEIDLEERLWQGLVLKEKDFRTWLKEHEWDKYKERSVAVTCSVDAIIPNWAYMLIVSKLKPYTGSVQCCSKNEFSERLWIEKIRDLDPSQFNNRRVVVKGCGDESVPPGIFAEFVLRFQDVCLSIMYGEPCSTVPIYKRPKN